MITFTGYKLSPLQKDVISEAVSSALDILVSKRMKHTLFFEIYIQKDLYKERNVWGDMDVEDHDEKSPKFYTIRLNYSGIESFAKMLETLAHELIHVEQFATRRLRNLAGPFRVAYEKDHYNVFINLFLGSLICICAPTRVRCNPCICTKVSGRLQHVPCSMASVK